MPILRYALLLAPYSVPEIRTGCDACKCGLVDWWLSFFPPTANLQLLFAFQEHLPFPRSKMQTVSITSSGLEANVPFQFYSFLLSDNLYHEIVPAAF